MPAEARLAALASGTFIFDLRTPVKLDTDMIRLVQTCYLSWIIVHTKFHPYCERGSKVRGGAQPRKAAVPQIYFLRKTHTCAAAAAALGAKKRCENRDMNFIQSI